jgi:eukaryotic-like serine/threonine-protein kinase
MSEPGREPVAAAPRGRPRGRGVREVGVRASESPEAAWASFTVESLPTAHVFINDRAVGTSPVRVAGLAPGPVKVEVVDKRLGYSRRERFTARPGENGTWRLLPGKGQVAFRVRPYATVFVDGKELGETPLEPVELYEGVHKVLLVNRELGREVSAELRVTAGGAQEFKYNLAQAEEAP